MGYMEVYKSWCDNMYFDEATRDELKSIANDEKEIEDRFYKVLLHQQIQVTFFLSQMQ